MKRVFGHVKVGDVDFDDEWATKNLTCIQKLHCVASCSARDLTKLCIKNLSCFCGFCLDEDYENYISSQHARNWCIHLLVPINLTSKILLKQQMMRMNGSLEVMEKILCSH